MCNSRIYPYPPQGGSIEIPRGRGFQQAILKKSKVNWKSQRGDEAGGLNHKTINHGMGMDSLWNNTIINYYYRRMLVTDYWKQHMLKYFVSEYLRFSSPHGKLFKLANVSSSSIDSTDTIICVIVLKQIRIITRSEQKHFCFS